MCEIVNSSITHEKSVNWWLPAGIIKIVIGTLHKIIITVPQMKRTVYGRRVVGVSVPIPPVLYIVLVPLKSLVSSYINYRYIIRSPKTSALTTVE